MSIERCSAYLTTATTTFFGSITPHWQYTMYLENDITFMTHTWNRVSEKKFLTFICMKTPVNEYTVMNNKAAGMYQYPIVKGGNHCVKLFYSNCMYEHVCSTYWTCRSWTHLGTAPYAPWLRNTLFFLSINSPRIASPNSGTSSTADIVFFSDT